MTAWFVSLIRTRSLELALALAVGYAAAQLAAELARVATHVLAQNFGHDLGGDDDTVLGLLNLFSSGPYTLNFTIGDTIVIYGEAVSATLALVLVASAGIVLVRRQARRFGTCPHCGGRVPPDAVRCAMCGSSLTATDA